MLALCSRLLQGASASVVYCVTPGGRVTPNPQLHVTHLRQVCPHRRVEGSTVHVLILQYDPSYVEMSSDQSGVLCQLCLKAEGADRLHWQLAGPCVPLPTRSPCVPHPERQHQFTQQLPPGEGGVKHTADLIPGGHCRIS